jgi:hypothetical protein
VCHDLQKMLRAKLGLHKTFCNDFCLFAVHFEANLKGLFQRKRDNSTQYTHVHVTP